MSTAGKKPMVIVACLAAVGLIFAVAAAVMWTPMAEEREAMMTARARLSVGSMARAAHTHNQNHGVWPECKGASACSKVLFLSEQELLAPFFELEVVASEEGAVARAASVRDGVLSIEVPVTSNGPIWDPAIFLDMDKAPR